MSRIKKRICIIAPSSLRYMPYLDLYLDILDGASVEYEVVYWDRFLLDEDRERTVVYRREGTASGLSLLTAYFGYRRFLKSYFGQHKFDMYIVLGVQVAVFMADFLRDKKYILDIRDYSHESFFPFRIIARFLIARAQVVCISSAGFLKWLPKQREYILSPNLNASELSIEAACFDSSTRIISYIGAIGYFDANAAFIRAIKAMPSWSLRYIGRGTQESALCSYASQQAAFNVFFRGLYQPREKACFYKETNFVLSCYGSESVVVQSALPNRLYESCIFRRPIIVNSGTYLAEVVQENGLGIVCDLDNLKDLEVALTRYYDSDYFSEYSDNCARFLRHVASELLHFRKSVVGFLSE